MFCHVHKIRHMAKIMFAVCWATGRTVKIKHTAKIMFAMCQAIGHTVKMKHTAKVTLCCEEHTVNKRHTQNLIFCRVPRGRHTANQMDQ